MTIDTMTTFLGWVTLINILILAISSILIIIMKDKVVKIHAGLFSLEEADVKKCYFQFLAHYKILILMFNLAPYLALRMVM